MMTYYNFSTNSFCKYLLPIVFFLTANLFAQHMQHTDTNSDNGIASKALHKIKTLKGKWAGNFKWTGAINGSGKNTVAYYLTGNNTSIVENIIDERGTVSMSSVYHLDGNALRMTHFCAANNHPRLKATEIKKDKITFELVDITNLKHKKAGHVYEVILEFPGDDQLTILFKYTDDGKKSVERIELKRQ